MADVQFGLFAALSGADQQRIEAAARKRLIIRPSPKITGFAKETELYSRAVSEVNQLRPKFVAMCGDMIQDANDLDQLAELRRITDQLNEDIPIKWVAGNHDIGNRLTKDSLRRYRDRFGKDDYFFDVHDSRFIVLNSNIGVNPSEVPYEWERQLGFLDSTLKEATQSGAMHIILFTHHPLFVDDPDEEDSQLVVPKVRRKVILNMLKTANASAVFSGHWHRNNYAMDGNLQMVTSAAVGCPLGYDSSGYRVVSVTGNCVEHKYVSIDEAPI
jgi:3',5'-cyclic AMP phosphodiesterase CpdA